MRRAPGAGEPRPGILSLVIENDIFFYENDRDCSSGVALAWVSTREPTPDCVTGLARGLPWFPEAGSIHHGQAFGQNVYTPRDITLVDGGGDSTLRA